MSLVTLRMLMLTAHVVVGGSAERCTARSPATACPVASQRSNVMPNVVTMQRWEQLHMNWDIGILEGGTVMNQEADQLNQLFVVGAKGVIGSGRINTIEVHSVIEGRTELCMIMVPGMAHPVMSLRSNVVPRATIGLVGGQMHVAINGMAVETRVDPMGPVEGG